MLIWPTVPLKLQEFIVQVPVMPLVAWVIWSRNDGSLQNSFWLAGLAAGFLPEHEVYPPRGILMCLVECQDPRGSDA